MKLFHSLHRSPRAKKSLIERVESFNRKLTVTSLLLLSLLLITVIGGTLIFSKLNKREINRAMVQDQHINISSRSKAQLTELTKSSNQIKLILITEVDPHNNIRKTNWWVLDDPGTDKIRLEESGQLPLPVFNPDPKNTQQMIAILSNEFICSPYADTIYAQRFGTIPPIKTLCQLAIPLPRFGTFAGILVFGLSIVPTKEEEAQLRLEASRIAVELFLRGEIK